MTYLYIPTLADSLAVEVMDGWMDLDFQTQCLGLLLHIFPSVISNSAFIYTFI